MKQHLAKAIRIATVPPIGAAILITLLWTSYPPYHALGALFCLAVLPALSYLVWVSIPPLRRRGRPLQRKLAVLFSVVGYGLGLGLALGLGGSRVELCINLCYCFSGALIALTSALGLRSSGHAAGVAGPIAVLSLWKSPWYLLGAGVMGAVVWSSLQLKRHTPRELLLGALYPTVCALVLFLLL